MSVPKAFWTTQLNGNLANHFKNLLNDEWINIDQPKDSSSDDDCPALLTSARSELVAMSQMFFEKPWFNISYEDREAETTRLYNEYRQAIATQLGDEGSDMDKLFKLNHETMYDDFPDVWDSPVVYELGDRVHLWVMPNWIWFLGTSQEDKELPIEIRFGRFTPEDMRKLSDHMSASSAG